MAHIYSQSFLNLAATVSRTSKEGLFRHRTPSDINLCFLDLRYNEWHADVFHSEYTSLGILRDVAGTVDSGLSVRLGLLTM
jgi:hypothetical protein